MDTNKADGRTLQKLAEWSQGTRPDEEESGFLRLVGSTDVVRKEIEACGVRIGTFGEVSTFHHTPLSALDRLLNSDPPFLAYIELSRAMRPTYLRGAQHPGLLNIKDQGRGPSPLIEEKK